MCGYVCACACGCASVCGCGPAYTQTQTRTRTHTRTHAHDGVANEGSTADITWKKYVARKINYETRKCDGSRRNSSEGLEEPGKEGVDNFFYYVVRSIIEDVRAGETTRGMEVCTLVLSYQSSKRWGHPGLVEL